MAAASTSVKNFDNTQADPEEQRWLREMESRGHLALRLNEGDSESCKTLANWLDQAVEDQLHHYGACARPSYVEQRPASVVPDQLYRARMLGYGGLALLLPSLRAFTAGGLLNGADSLALSEWRRQVCAHGVLFRVSSADAQLKLFPDPIPFERWLSDAHPLPDAAAPPDGNAAPSSDESRPIGGGERRSPKAQTRSLREAMRTALEPHSMVEPRLAESPVAKPALAEPHPVAGPRVIESPVVEPPLSAELPVVESVVEPPLNGEPLVSESPVVEPPFALEPPVVEPPVVEPLELEDVATPASESSVELESGRVNNAAASNDGAPTPIASAVSPRTDQHSAARASAHKVRSPGSAPPAISDPPLELLLENLEATDGSHAWAEIERLFVNSYLPLQRAAQKSLAPSRTEGVLATWAADFAESYTRAFEAIKTRQGKRPRLVLDTPSHAFQLCRQTETEQAKMVLVDGMRADLGPLVHEKLKLQLLDSGECVDKGLLWAALPADTPTQMELIARGMDGLRHFSGALSEQQLMGSGNDVRRLRPVRVGTHRMHKLDVVQQLVRSSETMTDDRLAQCAAEIATSVGRFIRQQGADTLIYVFGDHGFGGAHEASPERVLVPYQAWKVTA